MNEENIEARKRKEASFNNYMRMTIPTDLAPYIDLKGGKVIVIKALPEELLTEFYEFKQEFETSYAKYMSSNLEEEQTYEIPDEEEAAEEEIEEDEDEEEEDEEEVKHPKKEKKKKNKKGKNKNSKNNKKKKIILIASIAGAVILILGIGLFIVLGKKDDKKTTSTPKTWDKVLLAEADDGTLKRKIKNKLSDLNFKADEVDALIIDIDSDKDMELVIHAEDDVTDDNKLIVYDIAKSVSYSNDYDISGEGALAYAYNLINENMYYYVVDKTDYTVISTQDKNYTQDEFNENYYVAAHEYKKEEILDYATEIELDKKSDSIKTGINKAYKRRFTNKELLEDNDLSKSKIKDMIDEQIEEKEKQELEEQKKAEEAKQKELEEKKKQEQEQASNTQTASKLKVGEHTVEYKTYTSNKEILKLNGNGTCSYEQASGQQNNCTYKVARINFGSAGDNDYEWGIEITLKDGNNTVLNFEVEEDNVLSIQDRYLK